MEQPQIGQACTVVDEVGAVHPGLITAVHGTATDTYQPSINAVFTSHDATKTDPYGRQVERLSSLVHKTGAGSTPGRYWE